MSAFITVGKPFEILLPLCRAYLQPGGPWTSGTAREKDASLSAKRGALAEAISLVLTERRATEFSYLETIRQVDSWDTEKRLVEFLPYWPAADREATEKLLEEVVAKLLELAYDDDHKKDNDNKRRELILSGELDPTKATDEDMSYFNARKAEAEETASKLITILQGDKVNR